MVTALPEHVVEVAQSLSTLGGLEVFQANAASGKLVVVQEAASVGEEVEDFKRIRAVPHVIAADLVQHYFEQDNELIHAIPDGLDGLEGIRVPTELKDRRRPSCIYRVVNSSRPASPPAPPPRSVCRSPKWAKPPPQKMRPGKLPRTLRAGRELDDSRSRKR